MITKQQLKKCKVGDRVVWGTQDNPQRSYGTITQKLQYTLEVKFDDPDPDTGYDTYAYRIDSAHSLNLV